MNATFKYGAVSTVRDNVQKQIDLLCRITDAGTTDPDSTKLELLESDLRELHKIERLTQYMLTYVFEDDWEITITADDFKIMNRTSSAYI